MDLDSKFPRKRESRTRAPTACQTCRLRKTRCDNARPTCSYCAIQGVGCIFPETSPHPTQTNFESSNHEILQRLGHITSLLEDIKQGGGCFSCHNNRGDTAAIEDRAGDHDPLTLYATNSAEYMLRWPIYNNVITDAEKNIRSFLLDSLENQYEPPIPPPRTLGVGSFLDYIRHLCRRYIRLVHRRNPIVDVERLERYAREVTIQGLGWDGPSCQVLMACALACCTSIFIPLSEFPADLDRMPTPPQSDVSIELAEAYFHAAKQRLGS
ncbi:unnamed protein product [Penicillium pancosmium]